MNKKSGQKFHLPQQKKYLGYWVILSYTKHNLYVNNRSNNIKMYRCSNHQLTSWFLLALAVFCSQLLAIFS